MSEATGDTGQIPQTRTIVAELIGYAQVLAPEHVELLADDARTIAEAHDLGQAVLLPTAQEIKEAIIDLNTLVPLNKLDETEEQQRIIEKLLPDFPRSPVAVFAFTVELEGETMTPELVTFPGKFITASIGRGIVNWHQKLNIDDEGQPEINTGYSEPYLVFCRAEVIADELYLADEEDLFEVPLSRIVAIHQQAVTDRV